jgi:hypothetical protein
MRSACPTIRRIWPSPPPTADDQSHRIRTNTTHTDTLMRDQARSPAPGVRLLLFVAARRRSRGGSGRAGPCDARFRGSGRPRRRARRAVPSRVRRRRRARDLGAPAVQTGCTRPVRILGSSTLTNPLTGQIADSFDTADLPDGALYQPRGSRLASVSPACAHVYRYDTYLPPDRRRPTRRQGRRGVRRVAPPAVFATFTAPSSGSSTPAARTARAQRAGAGPGGTSRSARTGASCPAAPGIGKAIGRSASRSA